MKQITKLFLLIITAFLIGCSSNSKTDPTNNSTTKKKQVKEEATKEYTGKVKSYEDMIYPRFQFDVVLNNGEEKTFFFYVSNFPEVEKAMSESMLKDREITIKTTKISHPTLINIQFPSDNKTVKLFEDNAPVLADKEHIKIEGKLIEDVELNNDIYEAWIKIKTNNSDTLKLEGLLGVDKKYIGQDAIVTYYNEVKEEVKKVELASQPSPKELAIGKGIKLQTKKIILPLVIAKELYKEILEKFDVEEDQIDEFKNEPYKIFTANEVDLNNDGIPEILITQSGENYWCISHNCPIWIYGKDGNNYKRLLFDISISYEFLQEKVNGYYKFTTIGHGSAAEAYFNIYVFNKTAYKKQKCVKQTYSVDSNGNEMSSYGDCD